MKVTIRTIEKKDEEQVIIECTQVSPEVIQIQSFALSAGGGTICGTEDGKKYSLPLRSIVYFEAVDEHVFAYTKNHVYEIKLRLYEVETLYRKNNFLRCSKSVVLNFMALASISPAGNGRFFAHMKNEEKLVISRQYVPGLKQFMMERNCYEY